MWEDPIVKEIHVIRENIARECNYDMKRIIEKLKTYQEKYKNRLVIKSDKSENRLPRGI